MQIDVRSDVTYLDYDKPAPAASEGVRPVRPPETGPSRRRWFWPAAIITAFLFAAHGWALSDGLFLDDHLHMLRYADLNWSWQSLLDAATVKPDEFMHSWWQERVIEWHYTRPFSILLGKILYKISGGSPSALHAFSLGLHLASSLMVYALAWRLTRSTAWSIVAGLLFVVYSHSVYAVAWLAAQNSVLQTCLTLAAMLAYVNASGLDLYAAPAGNSAQWSIRPLRRGWFAASLALWVVALLSRETAIVLPVMVVSLDLAFGGRRQLRTRIAAYLAFALIGAAFVGWRFSIAYHPIPDFYVRKYDGPEYIFWFIAKLLHWITAAIWLSPMTIGPTARLNPFREVPWDCLLMVTIIGVMSAGYYLACRRARGWWLWPLWVLLTFLPVVPVMAGPQSGYMAGVGFAIAMVLGPALRDKLAPVSIGRWSKPIAIWFLIATCIYIPIYRAMWRSVNTAERFTITGVATCPPPPTATDLFFINLPFVNVYARLQVQEALACPDRPLRAHALTYAPNLLRVEQPAIIEQIDAYSFRTRIDGGRPYFSGALGRYLLESMRPAGAIADEEIVRTDAFEVRAEHANADGVRELTFRFPRPLASPNYCFYVTTRECGAARVRFWGEGENSSAQEVATDPRHFEHSSQQEIDVYRVQQAVERLTAGQAEEAAILFTALASADNRVQAAAQGAIRLIVDPVAAALASPCQGDLARPDWTSEDLARVRAWWSKHVDSANLKALLDDREESLARVWERDRLFRIREIASRIIRTDLYMTGPPFPSPR